MSIMKKKKRSNKNPHFEKRLEENPVISQEAFETLVTRAAKPLQRIPAQQHN